MNKIRQNFQTILWIALTASFLMVSCHKPEEEIPAIMAKQGIYILNEGLCEMNNSTLSYYNYADGTIIPDVFLNQNNRGLGDTGSDLKAYGSKLYCISNLSERVEIMDLSDGTSLKAITLQGKQPRKIAFYENFAYVSCYDGTILQIDTTSLTITATQQAGSNPEGLCVANHKLYVANSGGLNFPNYGNTLSVFNLHDFSFLKTITVGLNPYSVAADMQGDIYVVTRGNYNDVPNQFQRIDSQIDEVVQTFGFPVMNFTICDDYAYLYAYDFSTHAKSFKILDILSETVVNENFITDGTTIETPYCIAVNPLTHDIYITDAYQYTVNGDVYCFGQNGKKKFQFEAGLNPTALVFKY
ncbi:MAG: hypothetical protein M0P38_01345 [Bacteroidales bacterium]|jgi:DNA-binding beta-propeller fold protein YncE|nr:hypothetical protein [Bacteroidales bacterium]